MGLSWAYCEDIVSPSGRAVDEIVRRGLVEGLQAPPFRVAALPKLVGETPGGPATIISNCLGRLDVSHRRGGDSSISGAFPEMERI
jgi:hypothetical protein